jgi:hypothetical protein
MKRSRHVTIGLVVSVSLTLTGCVSDDDEDQEEYQRGQYSNIIYHYGSPYIVGEDRSVRPLPADHPHYQAAVAEGQAIASGNKPSAGKTFVSRGGFGSTGAHLSSAS